MKEDKKPARDIPLWETVVMAVCFVVLWMWFWARQNFLRTPGAVMSPLWQIALVGAVVVLVVIMIRRIQRIKRAFEEQANTPPQMPGMPFPYGMPDPRGEDKRRHN
jgi:MFS superfamily sulfate permease-like transporter